MEAEFGPARRPLVIEDLQRFYQIEHPPEPRPWVVMSMVASVDGASTLDGVSGPLGNRTDQQILRLARAAADTILVGAQTVRTERYRPVRAPKRLLVISRHGDLGDLNDLKNADTTTIVRAVPPAADVDLAELLRGLGGQVVVSEGGPSLNGQLLAAGLVDEVFLTISPRVLGGPSPRVAHHQLSAAQQPWELRHVLHDEGYLFLRYRSRRSSSASVKSSATSS